MSQTLGMDSQIIVEGAYGLPVATAAGHGPARGTIEWLLEAVERHAIAEQDALAEYEFVAEASADPVVALVMRLILKDEERHHGLLRRIETTLRDALNWTPLAVCICRMFRFPSNQLLAISWRSRAISSMRSVAGRA